MVNLLHDYRDVRHEVRDEVPAPIKESIYGIFVEANSGAVTITIAAAANRSFLSATHLLRRSRSIEMKVVLFLFIAKRVCACVATGCCCTRNCMNT